MNELKNTAKKALQLLSENGADKSQVTVSSSITHEFNVDGGQFSLFRTLFDKSIVMTAIKDDKKGIVRMNRYDDDTLMSLAEECVEVASSSVPDTAWEIAPLEENKDFVYGAVKPDTEKLFERTRELMKDISERYPKILMEQMIVYHKEIKSVYANSNGVLHSQEHGYYSVSLMFSAHDGDKASSFASSEVITDNLDKPFIECASLSSDLESTEKQTETSPLEGKFEGVILLPPACLSYFISMTLDLFAGGNAVMQGTSPWLDSHKETVADPRITVSSSPLSPEIVVGERVTDEGFLSENYDIIKDGVFESFMISQYVANKTGKKRARNSDFALVMNGGDKPLSEIISNIDRGVIVGRFSGGEPSPSGDFSGVAKNSFLIENGKITRALSETMISGNFTDMLKNLVAISSERVCDGNTVLPYVAFGGITISGK